MLSLSVLYSFMVQFRKKKRLLLPTRSSDGRYSLSSSTNQSPPILAASQLTSDMFRRILLNNTHRFSLVLVVKQEDDLVDCIPCYLSADPSMDWSLLLHHSPPFVAGLTPLIMLGTFVFLLSQLLPTSYLLELWLFIICQHLVVPSQTLLIVSSSSS